MGDKLFVRFICKHDRKYWCKSWDGKGETPDDKTPAPDDCPGDSAICPYAKEGKKSPSLSSKSSFRLM